MVFIRFYLCLSLLFMGLCVMSMRRYDAATFPVLNSTWRSSPTLIPRLNAVIYEASVDYPCGSWTSALGEEMRWGFISGLLLPLCYRSTNLFFNQLKILRHLNYLIYYGKLSRMLLEMDIYIYRFIFKSLVMWGYCHAHITYCTCCTISQVSPQELYSVTFY